MIDAMMIDQAAARLGALGNETRLGIYRLLVRAGRRGRSVGEIGRAMGVPGSTLTHHLKRLMAVGLITQERRGATLTCRANFEVMTAILGYLSDECCVEEDADESQAA